MHEKSKNDHFLVEKLKSFHKYRPAVIGTTSSTKFVFGAKVQNSASKNMSNLCFHRNSPALNIHSKSIESFEIFLKCKSKWV